MGSVIRKSKRDRIKKHVGNNNIKDMWKSYQIFKIKRALKEVKNNE